MKSLFLAAAALTLCGTAVAQNTSKTGTQSGTGTQPGTGQSGTGAMQPETGTQTGTGGTMVSAFRHLKAEHAKRTNLLIRADDLRQPE
jgi:hypothetical protein